MRLIQAGAASQSIYLYILSTSGSPPQGLTGLAYNTSSLIAYYVINGASAVAIPLVTLAAANSSWASGGFKEVDSTHCPGLYRLDLPNAVIASGKSVSIYLSGASGMQQNVTEIQLVPWNPQSADPSGYLNVNVADFLGATAPALGARNITVVGYVDASGNFSVQQGTAYTQAFGNAFLFEFTGLQDLTGVTVDLVRHDTGATLCTLTAVTTGPGIVQVFAAAFSATTTAGLSAGPLAYSLQAVISAVSYRLGGGTITVYAQY
jgi:hypothetical protein